MPRASMTSTPATARVVAVEAAPGVVLSGELRRAPTPAGAVLLVHAEATSRHDPRNAVVAAALARAGFTTLLLDLHTLHEAVGHPLPMDGDLLAGRTVAATHWLRDELSPEPLGLGYVGLASGVEPVLLAAAQLGDALGAVVCWGGDSAVSGKRLAEIVAPVRLIFDSRGEEIERCINCADSSAARPI